MDRWHAGERQVILYLPLKAEYFDAIKAGTKTREYRRVTQYWVTRLVDNRDRITHIELMRGYPATGDAERRLRLPWKGYTREVITHPHFGPSPVEVFAINVEHAHGGAPPSSPPRSYTKSTGERQPESHPVSKKLVTARLPTEDDCGGQGFASYAEGCNVCPVKHWQGDRPIRYSIVRRGDSMCCERCGGSFGPALAAHAQASIESVAARVGAVIAAARAPLHNEKATQAAIAQALEDAGLEFDREAALSPNDIPDFLVDGLAIEVKIKGGKRDIYRQLHRYAQHERVRGVLLVSSVAMGLPPTIEGRPAWIVSLGRAWL